jgi:hypothetical protein
MQIKGLKYVIFGTHQLAFYKYVKSYYLAVNICIYSSLPLGSIHIDAGGFESDDAKLLDCTLMALNYLEWADQHKIGKKS